MLAGRRARVLVVEDDDAMRYALVQSLAPEYEVLAAGHGAEGLEMAGAMPFDAIVTDVHMPHLDGIAMVRQLRARLAPARVPVLFLSAEATMSAVADGYGAGATAYLVKPVDLAWLTQEIRWMLAYGGSDPRPSPGT
jgi:two-component system response regulator MprA